MTIHVSSFLIGVALTIGFLSFVLLVLAAVMAGKK